jgi:hypothetical protein
VVLTYDKTPSSGFVGDEIAAGDRAPIRVVVAEDSYIIREFLTSTMSAAPEVELVAVCCDATERSVVARRRPDRHAHAAVVGGPGNPDRSEASRDGARSRR